MTKTIHFHWENRFVLQWYGAVRKLYHFSLADARKKILKNLSR